MEETPEFLQENISDFSIKYTKNGRNISSHSLILWNSLKMFCQNKISLHFLQITEKLGLALNGVVPWL